MTAEAVRRLRGGRPPSTLPPSPHETWPDAIGAYVASHPGSTTRDIVAALPGCHEHSVLNAFHRGHIVAVGQVGRAYLYGPPDMGASAAEVPRPGTSSGPIMRALQDRPWLTAAEVAGACPDVPNVASRLAALRSAGIIIRHGERPGRYALPGTPPPVEAIERVLATWLRGGAIAVRTSMDAAFQPFEAEMDRLARSWQTLRAQRDAVVREMATIERRAAAVHGVITQAEALRRTE